VARLTTPFLKRWMYGSGPEESVVRASMRIVTGNTPLARGGNVSVSTGQSLSVLVTLKTESLRRDLLQKSVFGSVRPVTVQTILLCRGMGHPLFPKFTHPVMAGKTELLDIFP